MTIKYKKVELDEVVVCIKRYDDAVSGGPSVLIPLDENNTDHIAWKELEAAGNTTEDAD